VKAVKRVITQVFSKGNFNPNSNDNYDYKMSNARKMGIKDDELKDEVNHDQILPLKETFDDRYILIYARKNSDDLSSIGFVFFDISIL
jgi:hypothetical protein